MTQEKKGMQDMGTKIGGANELEDNDLQIASGGYSKLINDELRNGCRWQVWEVRDDHNDSLIATFELPMGGSVGGV